MMKTTVLRGAPVASAILVEGREYRSRMIERYVWFLAKCEEPHVVDLGPISGRNISYFLEHASRLSVCDLIQRLGGAPQRGAENAVKLLDFAPQSVDGIHLWDIPDHLDNETLRALVTHAHTILRPGGIVLMMCSNDSSQPYQQYLHIADGDMVELSRRDDERLPYFHRANRDIQLIMQPFEQYCSFICLNSTREFLFRKPMPQS